MKLFSFFKHLNNQVTIISFALFLIFAAPITCSGNDTVSRIEYVVSMENPNQHYFNVSCTYSGIDYKSVEFKLPVWTPGYYIIMDYPKYVVSFKAVDGGGSPLVWKKTSKDTGK